MQRGMDIHFGTIFLELEIHNIILAWFHQPFPHKFYGIVAEDCERQYFDIIHYFAISHHFLPAWQDKLLEVINPYGANGFYLLFCSEYLELDHLNNVPCLQQKSASLQIIISFHWGVVNDNGSSTLTDNGAGIRHRSSLDVWVSRNKLSLQNCQSSCAGQKWSAGELMLVPFNSNGHAFGW